MNIFHIVASCSVWRLFSLVFGDQGFGGIPGIKKGPRDLESAENRIPEQVLNIFIVCAWFFSWVLVFPSVLGPGIWGNP